VLYQTGTPTPSMCPDPTSLRFENNLLRPNHNVDNREEYGSSGIDIGSFDWSIGNIDQFYLLNQIRQLYQVSKAVGNDDAADTFLWFFGGQGQSVNVGTWPIEKMLFELPVLSDDVSGYLGSSVYNVLLTQPEWGEQLSVPGCKSWRGHTNWRRVGVDSDAPVPLRNIYPNIEPQIGPGTTGFNALFNTDTIPQSYRNEFDWFIAMNAIYYAISYNIVLDQRSNNVQVAYQIIMEDYYTWYKGLSQLDSAMGIAVQLGLGHPYYIKSTSNVKSIDMFNLTQVQPVSDAYHGTIYDFLPPESSWHSE
jgi:hypothetical protein